MIHHSQLPDWIARDEADIKNKAGIARRSGWTVRELMDGEPVLLIMAGSQEDCRIAALAPRALRLLVRALKSEAIKNQHHVNEAAQLLDEAGISWR